MVSHNVPVARDLATRGCGTRRQSFLIVINGLSWGWGRHSGEVDEIIPIHAPEQAGPQRAGFGARRVSFGPGRARLRRFRRVSVIPLARHRVLDTRATGAAHARAR